MFAPSTRFLVIDDSSTIRLILKNTLIKLGFNDITEAADGQIGLTALEESFKNNKPIECIISDWNMPNMMGIDLLKIVRKTPQYKHLPFMLVTAENESKQVTETAMNGVSNYVVKPFTDKDIQTKLLAVYNRHQPKKAA